MICFFSILSLGLNIMSSMIHKPLGLKCYIMNSCFCAIYIKSCHIRVFLTFHIISCHLFQFRRDLYNSISYFVIRINRPFFASFSVLSMILFQTLVTSLSLVLACVGTYITQTNINDNDCIEVVMYHEDNLSYL
jgi:hypothetical protein